MKKVVISVAVLASAYLGIKYYGAGVAEQKFNEMTSSINSSNVASVKNVKYERGLFSSDASFDLKIKNPFDPSYTIDFKAQGDISTGLFGATAVFKFKADDSYLGESFKKGEIATLEVDAGLTGASDIELIFEDNSDEKGEIAGASFGVELDGDGLIDNYRINIDKFETKKLFGLEKFSVKGEFKNPVSLDELVNKVHSGTTKASLKKLFFESNSIENISLKSSTKVKGETYDADFELETAEVLANDVKLKNIEFSAGVKDFDIKTVESLAHLDQIDAFSRFSEREALQLVFKLASKSPSIKLKLSAENDKSDDLEAKIELNIDGDKIKSISDIESSPNWLRAELDAYVEPSVDGFFYQLNGLGKFADELLLNGNYAIQKSGKLKSSIEIKNGKIMLNGKPFAF